jgi:6-phosphogluconolactonase
MSRSPQPEIVVLDDALALARAAASRFVGAAASAIAARGRFAVALSGGKTPLGAFELLRQRTDVDWPHVEIFWVDERAVPPTHADSNFGTAEAAFLRHVPVPKSHVHRMPADEPDLECAAAEYEKSLRDRLGDPPRLDLVILGLGADGHTASLFPHQAALRERRRLVVVTPAPAIAPRLTLTFAAINAAYEVIFLVAGADKQEAVRRTLLGAYDADRVPAQAVSPGQGVVTWLLDREAAAGLGGPVAA